MAGRTFRIQESHVGTVPTTAINSTSSPGRENIEQSRGECVPHSEAAGLMILAEKEQTHNLYT
jgi:hypothetical protein